MDFVLFLLVNAILILRPGELFSVGELPIYEAAIIPCLLLSLSSIHWHLSSEQLAESPITCCVLGLMVAVFLSLLTQGAISEAATAGYDYFKILLYFVLLISVVNSVVRFERFLTAILWLLVALASIPLLQLNGLAHFAIKPALQEDSYLANGHLVTIDRWQSVNQDPNDLAMLIATGMLLCVWRGMTSPHKVRRLFWALPLALLGYVLLKTQSRGGLLCLLGGGAVLAYARLGARKALVLAAVAAPILLIGLKGRMTDFSAVESGTGQSRIQLWSDGLNMLRSNPLFGIGYNRFLDYGTHVAHNSFIQCFAELGLFGGTLFLGAYVTATTMLARISYVDAAVHYDDTTPGDIRLLQLRPYLLATVVAYIIGMLTLNRANVLPTYMILGMSVAWLRLAGEKIELPSAGVNGAFLRRLATSAVLFLVVMHTFVRVTVHW